MSVEVVRRIYEAWNRDDVEAALRHIDADMEFLPRLGAAGLRATLYRGHEGFLAYRREVMEALGEVQVHVLAIEALGGCVLAHIRSSGQGSASGVQVDAEGFHLWSVRAGRATRFVTYERRDEALEAARSAE